MLKLTKSHELERAPQAELHARPVVEDGRPPDVASNLRRLRHLQGHSLETLARLSGVSRAMLGQIETGRSAPTITLLWKIAKALAVPLSDLISTSAPPPAEVLQSAKTRQSALSDGLTKIRAYISERPATGFDVSEIEIAPKHREHFPAGLLRVPALLIVSEGSFSIQVEDAAPVVAEVGDAVLFNSSRAHTLSNNGIEAAIAYLVVAPQRNTSSK